METGDPYAIHGLWMQGNNPMANQAQDVRRHYNAAVKLDFNVVVDLFMTPTAQLLADIVLPAATVAEKDSVYCIGRALNSIHKLVDVPECSRTGRSTSSSPSASIPQAVPWGNVREMLDRPDEGLRLHLRGDDRPGLGPRSQGSHVRQPPLPQIRGGPAARRRQAGLPHPTGQGGALLHQLRGVGLRPAALLQGAGARERGKDSRGLQGLPADDDDRPALARACSTASTGRSPGCANATPTRWWRSALQTAAEKGIKNGDWVLIEGTMGAFKRKAKVTSMIDPRTIMVPHAWWLPEEKDDGPNPYKVWDLNCNQLIPMGYNDSSGFGGGPLSYMLVRVSRATD